MVALDKEISRALGREMDKEIWAGQTKKLRGEPLCIMEMNAYKAFLMASMGASISSSVVTSGTIWV